MSTATAVQETYIARARLKIAPDDFREVGQEVPEAASWPWTLRESYIRNGRLERATTLAPVSGKPAKGAGNG